MRMAMRIRRMMAMRIAMRVRRVMAMRIAMRMAMKMKAGMGGTSLDSF